MYYVLQCDVHVGKEQQRNAYKVLMGKRD